ncbi:MAG: iron-sulfur cluster assembly protein [Richelia sp. CSU_2_1]|nr:iron-sulfur cluster assembly protein [Richelia sp. CSU_2_1]
MKLDRKLILQTLETISVAGEGKNMIESGAVQNVVTFGNEIVIDLVLASPAMHIKKRAEDDIRKLLTDSFPEVESIKINTKVETPEKANEIKGKAIPGIKKYHCYCFW